MFSVTKTLRTASVALAATGAVAAVGMAGSEFASAQTTHARAPRCLVNHLAISMKALPPGAGQRYALVTLTNTGRAACSTGGYVGLRLTSAKGKPLPTKAVRIDRSQVRLLTLKHGQKASELLHWDVVEGGGACIYAQHLLVTPPNDYHAFILRWKMNPVCQNGRFDEQPLHFG